MSPKQLAANGRNAQKSTGPKTPEGRAVSKMNALKHGILSKEVLVRGLNLRESNREFSALRRRFWEELRPIGPVEEMLVDQIVTTHWRSRRALKAESGEIALNVDKGKRCQEPNPILQWMKWRAFGDPVFNMQESALGNALLERWLEEVRASVQQEGELTEAAIQNVVQQFEGKPDSLTRELEEFRLKLQQNPEGLDAPSLKEKQKNAALSFLNRKLQTIEWRKVECEKREKSHEQSQQAAAVLPSMEVLEKILRYETKLQKHLFRCMVQLERTQRMRRGESVPAPLTVEVSEGRE